MPKEPAWLIAARAQLGTRELPGRTHNNKLLAFLSIASRWNGVVWKNDEMRWCGGFVAACLVADGVEPVKLAARVKRWAAWGTNLRVAHLAPSAVLVFGREGDRHVCLYVGEDAGAYDVSDGNQGNSLSITWISKSRLIAVRWPRGVPVIGGPVRMQTVAGMPLS